jgi:hypothetical protein
VKVAAMDDTTHNPFNETHWVSCLRENLTSSSYGEGLETDRAATQVPRQSFTRQLMNWELKSGLGLGEHQVSGDTNRSEKSVGIAVLAYLFVLRVCHHEIVPGKPWSIFQLQHALRLRVMTKQVEHQVKVKMAKTRKAA